MGRRRASYFLRRQSHISAPATKGRHAAGGVSACVGVGGRSNDRPIYEGCASEAFIYSARMCVCVACLLSVAGVQSKPASSEKRFLTRSSTQAQAHTLITHSAHVHTPRHRQARRRGCIAARRRRDASLPAPGLPGGAAGPHGQDPAAPLPGASM
jgi:hypothetical protein